MTTSSSTSSMRDNVANTFETTFEGLDLSEFRPSKHTIDTETNTILCASSQLVKKIELEVQQASQEAEDYARIEEQAFLQANQKRLHFEQIRREARNNNNHLITYNKDTNVLDPEFYSTLVSMHDGDENGAKKKFHKLATDSKVRRKKVAVKTKMNSSRIKKASQGKIFTRRS